MNLRFFSFLIFNLVLTNSLFAFDNSIQSKYESGNIPFLDVNENDWFMPSVAFLKEKNWISGYKDHEGNSTGIFNPNGLVTKAEITKIAFLMAELNQDLSTIPQNTLAQDHWANHWIARAETHPLSLWANQIDPNEKATRGEVLQLIFEVLKKIPKKNYKSDFPDITLSNPYFPYIQSAKNLEIISGYPDGNFRPNKYISRGEIAKIIQRSFEVLKNEKPILSNLELKQYKVYAEEYLSEHFQFKMDVPGFFRFTSFDAKETEIMRFGFSRTDIVRESNIDFWLKIIGSESPVTKLIQKKIGDQVIIEFPREEFSRSFFRLEGSIEFLDMMQFLQKSIIYHEQTLITEPIETVQIPMEIMENLGVTDEQSCNGDIVKDKNKIKRCLLTTTDIGNSCKNGTDCESGYCMSPPDKGLNGACYGKTPLLGCVKTINEGIVIEVCE